MPNKLDADRTRTGQVLALVTRNELDRVKAWASGLDRTVSSAVRRVVLREIERTERAST